MTVMISESLYDRIVALRNQAAADVATYTTNRDQAEAERVARQQDVDEIDAIIASLTTS